MASRYYNPILARNLAKAYQPQVYDFKTGVDEAFEPWVAELKEQEELKRQEAEKYEKQQEKIRADQQADFRNMKSFDPNNVVEEYRDYAGQELFNLQGEYKYAVENLQGFEKQQTLNQINQDIDTIKNRNLIFGEYQEDYKDRHDPEQEGGSRISNVNDSVTLEMDRRKANREWDEVIEIDGVPHFVFNPVEGGSFEEPITISADDWTTDYVPLERQTAKYVAAQSDFDDLITTAKRDLRWEDDAENIAQIESILEAQTYTKDEALSVAVDYLGLEQEQYAGMIMKDLDGDGESGTLDDINFFIKDQLRTGVQATLKNLHTAYNKQKADADALANNNSGLSKEQQALVQQDTLMTTLSDIDFNTEIPKTDNGFIDIGSSTFTNMMNQLGFARVGQISEETDRKGNVTDMFVTVKNNTTNELQQISMKTLTDARLKRMMLVSSGMSLDKVELLYPLDQNFPKNIVLPGFEQPAVKTGTTTNTSQ